MTRALERLREMHKVSTFSELVAQREILEEMIGIFQASLEEVKQRITVLRQEVPRLNTQAVMPLMPVISAPVKKKRRSTRTVDDRIANAATVLMRDGSPVYYGDLLPELKKLGIEFRGQDDGTRLLNYIMRTDPRFERSIGKGRGVYHLTKGEK